MGVSFTPLLEARSALRSDPVAQSFILLGLQPRRKEAATSLGSAFTACLLLRCKSAGFFLGFSSALYRDRISPVPVSLLHRPLMVQTLSVFSTPAPLVSICSSQCLAGIRVQKQELF